MNFDMHSSKHFDDAGGMLAAVMKRWMSGMPCDDVSVAPEHLLYGKSSISRLRAVLIHRLSYLSKSVLLFNYTMMALVVTPLYAGILGGVFAVLSLAVGLTRVGTGVMHGAKEGSTLYNRNRAQGLHESHSWMFAS